MSAKPLLDALFEADRKLREAEAALLAFPQREGDADALAREFERATDQAFELSDGVEAAARLARLADLCAQSQGPRTADTLLRILNHPSPEVRVAAGEALRDFAYDRYAEVARAIERAIEQKLSGPALAEVPWILAEIGEPSALPLIGRMLKHPDAEVVASSIEALAELGDPAGAELLAPLAKDRRVVQLEEDDAGYTTTLGELASEALGELSSR
jgi:HEAT repeat protein